MFFFLCTYMKTKHKRISICFFGNSTDQQQVVMRKSEIKADVINWSVESSDCIVRIFLGSLRKSGPSMHFFLNGRLTLGKVIDILHTGTSNISMPEELSWLTVPLVFLFPRRTVLR